MVYFWIGIMIYLAFAAVFVTVKSIQSELKEHSFTFSELFTNKQFFTIIVSLGSTYVMWFIASLIFLDPWHMFTCVSCGPSATLEKKRGVANSLLQFIQYILLTPTYINVLNIYAFCNTHDITWGTKGDEKAEKLPSAHLKPGGKVDVNIPQDDGDLNAQYEAELVKFAQKAPKEKVVVSEEERQADYYKGFRTAVVLVWVFCNFALAAVVLSTAGLEQFGGKDNESTSNQRATIYMAVILWSVAAISIFKFCGAVWYMVVRMVSFLILHESFFQIY